MAHFAELDENKVVLRVLVVHNNELLDKDGIERESLGIDFLQTLYGKNTVWVQTSYNADTRKNYAGIGFSFDENRDGFIPPKEYDSWILDEEKLQYISPVKKPEDDKEYVWDESIVNWKIEK